MGVVFVELIRKKRKPSVCVKLHEPFLYGKRPGTAKRFCRLPEETKE